MHHTSGNESNKFYPIIRKANKTQFHLGNRYDYVRVLYLYIVIHTVANPSRFAMLMGCVYVE